LGPAINLDAPGGITKPTQSGVPVTRKPKSPNRFSKRRFAFNALRYVTTEMPWRKRIALGLLIGGFWGNGKFQELQTSKAMERQAQAEMQAKENVFGKEISPEHQARLIQLFKTPNGNEHLDAAQYLARVPAENRPNVLDQFANGNLSTVSELQEIIFRVSFEISHPGFKIDESHKIKGGSDAVHVAIKNAVKEVKPNKFSADVRPDVVTAISELEWIREQYSRYGLRLVYESPQSSFDIRSQNPWNDGQNVGIGRVFATFRSSQSGSAKILLGTMLNTRPQIINGGDIGFEIPQSKLKIDPKTGEYSLGGNTFTLPDEERYRSFEGLVEQLKKRRESERDRPSIR
jgi:hypothetical protein